jgi:hypothetical protein
MAAEKVYEGFLQMGKKRYAGLCHMPPAKPKVDSKGVESKRLDNCPLVRRMMERVFDLLLVQQNTRGALDYVHACLRDLIQRKVEFADLVITKSISKLEYKTKVVHFEVAKRMKARDPAYPMAPGERVPYVIVNAQAGAAKNAKVCDKAEDPLWAIQHGMEINVPHYIADISRPLSRVLMWYVAPADMLAEVGGVERAILAEEEEEEGGRDAARLEALEKRLKRCLEKMTDKVAGTIFGPGALADIPRPAPRFAGPMAKFLFRKPGSGGGGGGPPHKRSPADVERLEALRANLLGAKAKCVACRGREDDAGCACVQRDCANLFRVAMLARDIEDITRNI